MKREQQRAGFARNRKKVQEAMTRAGADARTHAGEDDPVGHAEGWERKTEEPHALRLRLLRARLALQTTHEPNSTKTQAINCTSKRVSFISCVLLRCSVVNKVALKREIETVFNHQTTPSIC